MKLEYYRQLDGVRAVAALMVMFFHFFGEVQPTDSLFSTAVVRLPPLGKPAFLYSLFYQGFLLPGS